MWFAPSLWASTIVAGTIAGSGRAGADGYEDAAERAVQGHIASAKAGDVAALRRGACGQLATDLDIVFVVEDHDGWKVCEIRRGNGIFGPLPGPFES
jgi:hypothetical protein